MFTHVDGLGKELEQLAGGLVCTGEALRERGQKCRSLWSVCKGNEDRPQFLLAGTGLGVEQCMSRIGKKCMETEAGKGRELGAGKLL